MAHGTARLLARFAGALLTIGLAWPAFAGPGFFDTGFSDGGALQWSHADDKLVAAARHPDGRIVLAGTGSKDGQPYLTAARLLADGSNDAAFGGTGTVVIPLPYAAAEISAVAIDGNGRYVFAGYAFNGLADVGLVIMLDTDGTPFSGFGVGGTVELASLAQQRSRAVTIDGAGGILVASTVTAGGAPEMTVTRLTPLGIADITFGLAGVATTSFGVTLAQANAIAIDPAGRVVVAGTCDTGTAKDTCVARFLAAGAVDTAFNGGGTPGRLVLDASGTAIDDGANAVAIYPDSRILLAGFLDNAGSTNGNLVRLTAAGGVDTVFGGGPGTFSGFGGGTILNAASIAPDGRIYVTGSADFGVPDYQYIAAVLADGGLDAAFEGTGENYAGIGAERTFTGQAIFATATNLYVATREGNPGSWSFRVEERVLPTGALTSWAFGGYAFANPYDVPSSNEAIALQGGSYILAGYGNDGSSDRFTAARVTSAGELDPTFGVDGRAWLAFQGKAAAAAVDTSLRIVLAGQAAGSRMGVVRLLPDGTPDPAFGSGGAVTLDPTADTSTANAVAIQPDGKILLGGWAVLAGQPRLVVARILDTGAIDTTFGNLGYAVLIGLSPGFGYSMLLQPDGRIVLVGTSTSPVGAFLLRLTSGGGADPTFGTAGQLLFQVPGAFNTNAFAAALQPDGRIVLTGYVSGEQASWTLLLARVTAGGALDPSFGTGGTRTYLLGSGDAIGYSVAVEGNGRIVVGGVFDKGFGPTGLAARFRADGAIDAGYGPSAGANDLIFMGRASGLVVDTSGFHVFSGVGTASGSGIVRLFGGSAAQEGLLLPSAQDFGSVPENAGVAPRTFVLTNIGDLALTVNSVTFGGANPGDWSPATIDCGPLPALLPPGAPCQVTVNFTPGAVGPRSATLQVITDAPTSPSVATLTGTGIDAIPDPFAFTPLAGQPLSTLVVSNTITVTGIATFTTIGIVNGEFSIGCTGTFQATGTFIFNDQTVCVRHTTAATPGTPITTTLTIGGVQATFTSTTAGGGDTTPDAFSFIAQANVALGSVRTSNAVTITGIDTPSPISVSGGGTYSIGCAGPYDIVPLTVSNGQAVCVRHTHPLAPGSVRTTTLTVGGVSGAFTTTGIDVPSAPIAVSAVSGNGIVTVNFSPPATDGGSPITSYEAIPVAPYPGATVTGSPAIIAGLPVGAVFTFVVRAFNAAGQGADSAPSAPVVVAGSPASVAASAGNGQSAAVGQSFALPLAVTVRDAAANPVGGVLVTFSAPPFGPTSTLSAITAVTNGSGVASITATANNQYGSYNVTVSAAGVASPALIALTNVGAGLQLGATQLGFGNRDVGTTTSSAPITISNPGNAPLTITAITASDPAFSQAGNCVGTFAPGGSCQLTLRFSPTAEGPRSGQVAFACNGVSAPYAILVSGNGIDLSNPAGDADGDGIPNGVEASVNTNALARDNDVFANARLFAMQQYRDFLGREGDAGGIDFFIGLLNTGTLRAQVIENFFNSPEFAGSVSPIVRLYFATFDRIPDYGGLLYQVNALRAGAPLAVIANNFSLSPEFVATYGALGDAQYVTLLYQNVLGRTPVQAEVDYHVARLASGATRGEVMAGFSESPEYIAATANDVYVTMMYVGMLRRAPEQAGFDYWVDYMDAGNPGLNLILGFLNAPEYHDRFLP